MASPLTCCRPRPERARRAPGDRGLPGEAEFHVARKSRVAGKGISVDHKIAIFLDGGRVGRGGGRQEILGGTILVSLDMFDGAI